MSSSNSRGQVVVITSAVFVLLATICVSARFYSRIVVLRSPGLDELAIGVSFACSVCLFAMTVEQANHGLGRHIDDVSLKDIQASLKILWISIMVYNISLGATKASIVFQYLRVFPSIGMRRACFICLAAIAANIIYATLTNIFACIPVNSLWSPSKDMHCINTEVLSFFNASFNIVSDMVILILPMPVIKRLRLPRRHKIALMAIFALGGLNCVISILRLQSLYAASKSKDSSYANVNVSICSSIEVYTGIICASLPAIKPALVKVFPKLLPSIESSEPPPTATRKLSDPNQTTGAHIRFDDVELENVIAGRKAEAEIKKVSYFGHQIFVPRSAMQDGTRYGENSGSDEDLIIQHP